jgi:hypothetical protein
VTKGIDFVEVVEPVVEGSMWCGQPGMWFDSVAATCGRCLRCRLSLPLTPRFSRALTPGVGVARPAESYRKREAEPTSFLP